MGAELRRNHAAELRRTAAEIASSPMKRSSDGDIAQMRRCHADELRRTVAECAETLAKRDTELERQQKVTEEQWKRRLSVVEEDLRTAREELWHERDLAVKAQADGERAVLRTIEGFWKAHVDHMQDPQCGASR